MNQEIERVPSGDGNHSSGGRICAHCEGKGTCRTANDGSSCLICIRKNNIKPESNTFGLVCSVCGGRGYSETTSEMMAFMNPIVGVLLGPLMVLGAFLLVKDSLGQEYLDRVLTFSASIIGAVTGFFFGSKISK